MESLLLFCSSVLRKLQEEEKLFTHPAPAEFCPAPLACVWVVGVGSYCVVAVVVMLSVRSAPDPALSTGWTRVDLERSAASNGDVFRGA
ncbi:hypothetical protein AOLI_G00141910 [Acnodon oligacanthus]